MINAAFLSKIECQKLTLGIMSYLQDKIMAGFPYKYYKVIRDNFLKTKNYNINFAKINFDDINSNFLKFYFGFIQFTNLNSRSAAMNNFQAEIRSIIPTGIIQAIHEDNGCKVKDIELNPQVITFGSKLFEEETYNEIPVLADMCEDYGYTDHVNHFRCGTHTCMCPYLQAIWNKRVD